MSQTAGVTEGRHKIAKEKVKEKKKKGGKKDETFCIVKVECSVISAKAYDQQN
jgi:hypothetical protein